jgi:hypothetical protein
LYAFLTVDSKRTGDLSPGLTLLTKLDHLLMIENRSGSTDGLPGSRTISQSMVQPGNHPLSNDAALKLGHGRDSGEHRLAHRR